MHPKPALPKKYSLQVSNAVKMASLSSSVIPEHPCFIANLNPTIPATIAKGQSEKSLAKHHQERDKKYQMHRFPSPQTAQDHTVNPNWGNDNTGTSSSPVGSCLGSWRGVLGHCRGHRGYPENAGVGSFGTAAAIPKYCR